jgi:hypothetical protein
MTVVVEYKRPDGPRETTKLSHDLAIFRELAYPI